MKSVLRLVCVFVFVALIASCADDDANNDANPDTGTIDAQSDVSDVSDVSDISDLGDSSDGNDAADASDTSDVSDTSDAADASDTSDVSDTSDTADASDTQDTADAGDAQDGTDDAGDAAGDAAGCGSCDDGNACTVDECVDGVCENTVDTTLACDDGDACTENDTCDASGQCAGQAVSCDDSNMCTTDSCNPSTGQCEATPASGGTCDDGDACTGVDTCDGSGGCAGSTELCCGDYVDNDADGNADCTDPDCSAATVCQQTWTIGWCVLQYPTMISETAGSTLTVYGRLWVNGLTDQSDGVDRHPNLIAQVGYGADGSNPTAASALWTWFDATPNVGWSASAAGSPNNDEYQADLTVPTPGTYDHAYRFSGDGGTTWTYCDTVDHNYDVSEAGEIVVQ